MFATIRHGQSTKPKWSAMTEPDRKKSGRRYFVGGGLWLMGLRLASVGLGLAASALLARYLGATEFGVFAFGVSLATLLALPLTGGLPTLLLREIAAARARSEPQLEGGVIRWGYRMLLGASLGLLVLALLGYLIGTATGLWPWDERMTWVALLVVLLVPGMSLLHVQRSILSGYEHVVLGGLGEQLFRPFVMVALLLGAPVLLAYGSAGALGMQLLAVAVAVVLGWVMMRRVLPSQGGGTYEIRHSEWLRALLPLTALSATTIIKNNTDILMLGVMQPAAEVGTYRIAAQVAVLTTIVMQILRSLSAPRIAAAHARGDQDGLQAQFVYAGRAMFVAALGVVVLFAAFGSPVLVWVFGPDYAASYWPCLVLALGALFSSGCGLVGVALQVTKHAHLAARSAVIAAVVNVVLNLVLIPLYGATGAAIATSIALVVMQTQQWLIARRVLGLRTDAFQRMSA